jgi:hypothetical protein
MRGCCENLGKDGIFVQVGKRQEDKASVPQVTTDAFQLGVRTPVSGSAIKQSQQTAIVKAISTRFKRSVDVTRTSSSSRRLLSSQKDSSIQKRRRYQVKASCMVGRLVAKSPS